MSGQAGQSGCGHNAGTEARSGEVAPIGGGCGDYGARLRSAEPAAPHDTGGGPATGTAAADCSGAAGDSRNLEEQGGEEACNSKWHFS